MCNLKRHLIWDRKIMCNIIHYHYWHIRYWAGLVWVVLLLICGVIIWSLDCRHGEDCTSRGTSSWELEQGLLRGFWKHVRVMNRLRLETICKPLKSLMAQGLVLKTSRGSCLNLKWMCCLTWLVCIIAWQALGFRYSILFPPLLFFFSMGSLLGFSKRLNELRSKRSTVWIPAKGKILR